MGFRFLLGWYRSDKFRVDVIIFATVDISGKPAIRGSYSRAHP